MLRRQPSWIGRLSPGSLLHGRRLIPVSVERVSCGTWKSSRQAANDAKRNDQNQSKVRRVAAAAASQEIQTLSQGMKPTAVTAPIDLRSLNEASRPVRSSTASIPQHSTLRDPRGRRGVNESGRTRPNYQNFGIAASTESLGQKRPARISYRNKSKDRSVQRQSTKVSTNVTKSMRNSDALNSQLLEGEAEIFTEDDALESDFENLTEMKAYLRLNSALERLGELEKEVAELHEQGANPDKITNLQGQINTGIAESLQYLADIKSALANPPHIPEFHDRVHPPGSIGDVPVGRATMARVAEDGLRYLAERHNMHWKDPKALKVKLMDGELTKFKDEHERKEVLHFLRYEPALRAPGSVEAIGSSLTPRARRKVVEQLVRGNYADRNSENIRVDFLRNMMRIATGNPTLLGLQTNKMVKTIQSFLPTQ